MSPPRRRSSRLRGSNATPKTTSHAANRLDSLAERDETPSSRARPNHKTIVSSPSAPRTPATAPHPKPSREEMHPSKVHQSTTKEPDSGLRLGFTNIGKSGNAQPSGVAQQTPSKTGISSSFDFRFARPTPELGPDAQRMMDELREEALKIKKRLASEREEQKRQAEEEASCVNPRKIAQPKGKAGRFSGVHMAEFKKMDSIAGHPSSFRAQPSRVVQPPTNLKRKQSRAQLDDREDTQPNIGRSHEKSNQSERLENTAPVKRIRKDITDDASSSRPISRSGLPQPTTPSRTQSNFLAAITTPTTASLARSTTTKQPGSQIPTLSRSPSKPALLGTPRGIPKSAAATSINPFSAPKSTSKGFLRSPGRFERVRSILRRVSPGPKKITTAAPSAIPSLARSPSKPNINKAFQSVPTTPTGTASKSVKHVNFTPDTRITNATTMQNSPSPMKSAIPRSTSTTNLKKMNTEKGKLKSAEVHYPSLSDHPNIASRSHEVDYPSIADMRPLSQGSSVGDSHPPPYVPGTFTFRADSTINFGASPKGFGSSRGQASVRPVRPSIAVGKMPGSFPGGKENTEPLPSVPHGMSNKKRHRAESDDETEDEASRSPKKHKTKAAEGEMLMAPRLIATPKSRLGSPEKKKHILSMSRLNMLARPKLRK
ncbi:hypothetical protein BGZ60DRAFT_383078 [Tricladium varicosporioides]|nr:hypothetical protein BGZ60DRAFT_383078 [Hymenoscyphus varicosporioides]